jgi:uncharacterized protein YgiB involved in biofilm formation
VKRTHRLALGGFIAAGGFSLSACGASNGALSPESPGAIAAFEYQTVPKCKASNEVPDSACERAAINAVEDDGRTAHWPDRASCEQFYGWGQCAEHGQTGGRSAWGPLVVGFVVGRVLSGDWAGRGLYRDWRSGAYYTAGGGRIWTDYATGRTLMAVRSFDRPAILGPPERVVTNAPIISRRGFGRRVSRRGGGGGHWGG